MSQDDARALACCAILTAHNDGPKAAMSFVLPKSKADAVKQQLVKDWDVFDWGTSLALLERLSRADADCPVINEIFEHIIAKSQYEITRGIFAPLKQDALPGLDLPRNFENLWDAVTNNANSDMGAFMHFLSGAQGANKTFHSITASALLNRINAGISGYEKAIRTLIVYGYSMDELAKICDFSAWDLGRTGYLSKMAAVAGFIDETTSHQYMVSAGKLAYKAYLDWRQFLAAYFIGHSIVYGSAGAIGNFRDTVQYLLKHKKSPYQKFPLKSA
ncbi:MAG: DUF1266 domain-containing protein [Clostridiales bacterium]|nr:DUF1266 domain-containing protein [Clostridiales bacterium]